MNLFKLAEKLNIYLLEKGVEFTEEGYPIFTEDMLLKEMQVAKQEAEVKVNFKELHIIL